MSWLEPIEDDTAPFDELKGGMEDVGNFKEGFCFRLKS
jgi:hypothetical protein